MKLVSGLLVVFGCVLGGFFAMGGNLLVLWQPWEFVIIVGAAMGAYIIANSGSVIKDTVSSVLSLTRGKPHSKAEYLELLTLLFMLFKQGKSNLNQLEADLDAPETSQFFANFDFVSKNPKNVRFIADYFRLFLLGSENSHEIDTLLETEIETMEIEGGRVPKALAQMADSLPALGIVAAVLGVIKAMGAISEPPEVLGYLIGGALVGTFLGVLLSYGFVGPLANAIRSRREQEMAYYVAIKTSIVAYLNGYAPEICVEYARKVISSDVRPEFEEVERTTKETAKRIGLKA